MLGNKHVFDIILPKIKQLVSDLNKILTSNEDLMKEYISKKYGILGTEFTNEIKITNTFVNNQENNKLKEIFPTEINFSQTFNINTFNFDILCSFNKTSFDSLKYNSEEEKYMDILSSKVRKALSGKNSIIHSVSFVYLALKVILLLLEFS